MAGVAIGAGASLLGGVLGGKGAAKAAKAQAAAAQQGINLQRDMFNTTQANIQPDVNAGNSATQQILRLLGLGDMNTGMSVNGNPALSADQQQTGALANLKNSPLFTGAYDTGADTILQNASATGGLRGGNVNNSLAQFGSGLFSSVLQQQLANLSGLSNTGANAASGLASAGQNSANATSNLLTQQGAANGTAAAAPYAALQQVLSGLGSSGIGSGGSSLSGLSSLLSPQTGGGGISTLSGYTGGF